jgi:hypothetical protein
MKKSDCLRFRLQRFLWHGERAPCAEKLDLVGLLRVRNSIESNHDLFKFYLTLQPSLAKLAALDCK